MWAQRESGEGRDYNSTNGVKENKRIKKKIRDSNYVLKEQWVVFIDTGIRLELFTAGPWTEKALLIQV